MGNEFDLKEARNRLVAKDNRIIQNSRFALSKNESKAIQYLISKIQPNDKAGKKYHFNCKEFQALIKWNDGASYKGIKEMLTSISDARCWIDNGDDTEALVRWFNVVHIKKGTGDVEISFHEDMFPYLLNLRKNSTEEGHFFTTYKLQNVALMKHRYSPRIYEILKSYQFNNKKWTFENGTATRFDLQRMIGDATIITSNGDEIPSIPANWSNWAVFKRDVLTPAVEEINKYTDIKVAFKGKKEDIHRRKTRAIRTIEFYMAEKTDPERRETDNIIDAEYTEIEDSEKYHQMSLEEFFFKEHEKSLEEERREKEIFEAAEKERKIDQAKHQILFSELNGDNRQADFDEKKVNYLYDIAIKGRVVGKIPHHRWELFAVDLIIHYYDKIIATSEDTKTSTYKRLIDSVENDYEGEAKNLIEKYKD